MTAMQIGMGVLILIVVGLVLYLIVAGSITLALKFHVGAGTKNGWWYTRPGTSGIPTSWLDWAGYPATYRKLTGTSSNNASIYEVLDNVPDIKTCMLKCDKKSADQESPECLGFIFQPSSNTCHMIDGIDYATEDTANTLYLYTSKSYTSSVKKYVSHMNKSLPNPTLVVAAAYTETNNLEGCMSNCLSNTACTGFMYVPATKLCSPVSNMNVASLVTTTGTDSYHIDKSLGTADTTKYWT